MRTKGKITSWNDEKGFGFITPGDNGKQVFVHIKAFSNRTRRPETNQLVSYKLSVDRQGRPCAVLATLAGDRLPQVTGPVNGSLSVACAILFLVIVGVCVLASKLSPVILSVYVAASLLAFIMYAIDKSAARKGTWRIKENTLHLLSLAGGWPGALIGQQLLRHKSRKKSFRSVFWLTVFLNCCAFTVLLSPTVTDKLQNLVTGAV